MDEIKTTCFGTLYDGGEFLRPTEVTNGGPITFLDSALNSVKWARVNGNWYCVNVYCLGISWEELRVMGYVYGRPVCIDGAFYLCRCPELTPYGEWDKVITATKGVVDWGNTNLSFFGKEYLNRDAVYQEARCAICGCVGLDMVGSIKADEHASNTGFRPVLEPIDLPGVHINSDMLNTLITVYLGEVALRGSLMEYTDYDLVLQYESCNSASLPDLGRAALVKDGKICIDRNAILFVR